MHARAQEVKATANWETISAPLHGPARADRATNLGVLSHPALNLPEAGLDS